MSEQDAPQLVNVVRELSLAANVPMPRVYLIDDTAPNAFATGRDPQHASVAITTGLLEKLDREELQGVIGHELSHVRNYDIRFSLLVGVLVGSHRAAGRLLPALHLLGQHGLGGSRRAEGSGGGGQAVFIVVGHHPGHPRAHLRRAWSRLAVNRQREYLADASSVELTRNPYGLERALAKIAADQEPLEVANRATQHLYVVNPIKKLDDSASGPVQHPPAHRRSHQPAAGPDRRATARRHHLAPVGRPGLIRGPAATRRRGRLDCRPARPTDARPQSADRASPGPSGGRPSRSCTRRE